jgi:iron complex outermembrane receptor protein
MKKTNRRGIDFANKHMTPVISPLAAAVVAALWPASAVLAQDDDDTAVHEPIEEIVTTGSRIRRDSFSSAAPMDVVLTEAAASRGINDVATLLQTTTVAAGAPQVTAASTSIFVQSGGLGTSTISLRGLGANRTLVLLNGRRAGPSGVGGSVSAFDLNAIPLPAVERVEVLKDGASSIYGSDAVAGVVNIITKKTDGGSFEAFVGQPAVSGGEQTRFSGSWGKELDRGYFRATVDYNKTEILQRRDRDYFNCEEDYTFDVNTGERADLIDPRTGKYLCNDLPWGHVWVYDYAAYVGGAGDGTTNVGPPTYLLQYDFDGLLSANGLPGIPPATNPNHMTTPPGWYPIRQGDALSDSLYDAQHPLHGRQTLVPESEVTTLFLEGEYELTDNTTAYSEFMLNRRKTEYLGYLQIWSYIYNYDSADLGWPSDPFSVGWTGAQWLSPLSVTDQYNQNVTVDYARVVLGLKGETESFLPGWNWDVSFQYSDSDGEYKDDVVLNDALTHSFWRTGSCVGETTAISNRSCVDIPWLDPNFLRGEIPADVQNFLYDTDVGNTKYTQWSTEGFMTGDIFEMPAGSAALAVGVQYIEEEITDTPGPIISAGNAWQFGTGGVTTGNSDTTAVFAEIDIPLLADKPMAHYLDFNASARYTNVSASNGLIGYDADDTTYKVGMNWAITETFRARSTYGTSFRTPALFELFLSNESSFLSARAADPCINWGTSTSISSTVAANCAADGLPPNHVASVGPEVLTGGGADVLIPETSEAFTFGLVWRPESVDLSVSVDYFDILVEDEIDKIGGAQIVLGCYSSQFFPNEPLCDQFDRDLPTAPLPNAILTIRDSFINVAKQQARGVDLAAAFNQDLSDGWGTLSLDTQWTLSFEDTVALFDNTEEDLSGLAGHPETVGNFNATLRKNDWSFTWGLSYIGETDNTERFRLTTGDTTVVDAEGVTRATKLVADSVVYHSLSASYAFDNGLTALIGVANATDEAPPRVTSWRTSNEVDVVGQSAFYSQYDWLGRRFFANVKMEF